ncbi:MAG: homoaconitase [Acidobacteria bacterium]|nr:homoaconitase [Acidobacteriota bacterium]
MGQTITEKIVQAHAVGLPQGHLVGAGDMVTVRPFHVMTHDNTGAVLPKFRTTGTVNVADPTQPVFALDHNVQDRGEKNLAKYAAIEAFAREQGIVFHRAGDGIGHQLMIERGFVHPGTLVVASDSHSNMYGALAAVGTPVVRTDAAAIWATGTTWWQVPRTVRIVLEGYLRPGVTGKDVIITLCGMYSQGEVLNAALEFDGPGVAALSIEERMTIANMTTEWGALVGWFPFDSTTAAYLRERAIHLAAEGITERLTEEMIEGWEARPPVPDPDASYAAEIILDLAKVSPHVAGPDTVFTTRPVSDIAKEEIKIHKAYLLSCVNARLADLTEAADVLRGRHVADGVELYVAAASAEVQKKAESRGVWQAIVDAGAKPLPPGCGACIGLGTGLLEPGEVGISATNRNFKGRMGSRDAQAYLASPAVVAASAVAGTITGPAELGTSRPPRSYRLMAPRAVPGSVDILPGFPDHLEGRLLLLPTDNLNTDGIYGKDVTYRDDLTPEQMATYAMLNYDPEFQRIVRDGDIILAGSNFGTGSSREQAATALKHRGVRLVIAGSFSATYLKNAFNNAFVCLESAELAAAVREAHAAEATAGRRTVPAGLVAIDFRRSTATWRDTDYSLSPLGVTAQELVLAGGLEALTRRRLGL